MQTELISKITNEKKDQALLVGFLIIIYISVDYNDASTVGMNLLKFQ